MTPMNVTVRGVLGFLFGGVVAATAAGESFKAIYPLPAVHNPRDHTAEVYATVVIVMFFCGGFIGRRGVSARSARDFMPSVVGTYLAVVVLSTMGHASGGEMAALFGFATIGVVASALCSKLVAMVYPPRGISGQPDDAKDAAAL